MKQALLPYLRTAKLLKLRAGARYRCVNPHAERDRLPVRFIVGCGRSGTTVLGQVVSMNPSVNYLREPYHLWQTIDTRMDVTGLHSSPEDSKLFFGRDDSTPEARAKFDKLIARSGRADEHECVIEKTPHNAARLGWIRAAVPNPSVLHMVRNGLSVVRSIGRIASKPYYRLGFKPSYNQWWGTRSNKWRRLSREAVERGYFPDEVNQLTTNEQKGAYEWLVSLGEVDRWRETLGDQLMEVTYTDLTEETEETCERIASHFEIPCNKRWVKRSKSLLSRERINKGSTLQLPRRMCARFNEYQQRYGFAGRAEPIGAHA